MSSFPPWSSQELSRRRALGLLAGAGAWLTLASCTSDPDTGDQAPQATEPGTSDALTTPTPTTTTTTATGGSGGSAGGQDELSIRLWAEPATAEIVAGSTTDVYSFGAEVIDGDPSSIDPSGSYLGPTLHFHQGQRVRVSFENRLPD